VPENDGASATFGSPEQCHRDPALRTGAEMIIHAIGPVLVLVAQRSSEHAESNRAGSIGIISVALCPGM
jgi:hypothetical protein